MADIIFFSFCIQIFIEDLSLITVEVKKEPNKIITTVKDKIKNDSDSEDEGKKDRQRFKSERPKEQHKIVKHEPSMSNQT